MRFWFFIKLVAFLAVLGVMAFTGLLAYHVTVTPLGGVFEKVIPNPTEVVGGKEDVEFAKMLDSAELPDIDPGEKAFQKAHELLAMGRLEEAREKLTAIVNVFPSSSSAPKARRIVGDMNLDEVLSSSNMDGKEVYVVKRGDSFNAIANRNKTSLDMIMHLNGLMELGNLQPGDELILMPLNFRILIEPQRQAVSLWDGGRFLREYPVVELVLPQGIPSQKTTIDSETGYLNGRQVRQDSVDFRASEKIIGLAKSNIQIRSYKDGDEGRPRGIYLRPVDVEELVLLVRVGNEVEIRNPTR